MNYWRLVDKLPFKKALKSILVENDFIKNSTFYKKILDLLIQKRIQGYEKGPEIVLIENTNYCNAKCVMCPHSTGFKRQKRTMSFELFKKIADEMAQTNIKRLQITGTGEPMLDNNLSEKIEYSKKKGIEEVNIFTNGSLLTEEIGIRIIDSGLDLITFSFDGIEKSVFEKIRIGLEYDTVTGNILNFLKLKKKKNAIKPHVFINSFVIKNNYDYFNLPLIKEINSHVDHWSLNPFEQETHSWGGGVTLLSSKNNHDLQAKDFNIPCRRLWSSFNILWDGQIVPCCMDYEGLHNFKNISNNRLIDIWLSAEYEKFRELHMHKKIEKIEMCRKCSERLSWIPKNTARMLDMVS